MKKIIGVILVLALLLSTCACTIEFEEKEEITQPTETTDNTIDDTTESIETTEPITEPTTVAMTVAELEEAISKQEVKITSTKYVVQDENYKALYPDMLQAIITNNSNYDLKNALVAFVAWDENNLPVKIVGQHDFSGGHYVKGCNYSDINLVPGKSYGSSSGLSLDEDNNIDKFKAIVVSYETFDGETWENPYYDMWVNLYSEKRYSE